MLCTHMKRRYGKVNYIKYRHVFEKILVHICYKSPLFLSTLKQTLHSSLSLSRSATTAISLSL